MMAQIRQKLARRVPFTMFGQTRMVPLRTYTDGKDDFPYYKGNWADTLWVERGEDWYALMSRELRGKTVLVVRREDWLSSPEAPCGKR
jgi:hypothetical protein